MQSNNSEKREPAFSDYLRVLLRNRLLIVGVLLVTVGVTAVFTFTTRKVYQAQSTIMVEVEGRAGGVESVFGVPSFMQLGITNEMLLSNQVEILRSRMVAERVIANLRARPDADRLGILGSKAHPAPTADLLEELVASTEISPIENTNIIRIGAKAGSPHEASVIANTIADAYLELNRYRARGEVAEVKSFLEEQSTLVRERLSKAEEALKSFQEREKVASLSDETEAAVKKLAEFEALRGQAQVDLEAAERRLSFLETQLSAQKTSLVEDIGRVSAPVVTELRNTLANLEGIRTRYLAQGYTDNHEKMQEINRRIEETKSQLVDRTKDALSKEINLQDPFSYSQQLVEKILGLEVEVRTLRARVEGFDGIIRDYNGELEMLPGKALMLARLERDKQANEQILVMLMGKYEEARIKEAGQLGSASVIDVAQAPREPILPRKKRNLVLGFVAGLLLGVIGAFSVERFRDRIEDASDIELLGDGIPLLASIPSMIDGHRRQGLFRARIGRVGVTKVCSGGEDSRVLLAEMDPRSPASESYRSLRTNILFSQVDEPLHTIVVTSPGPSEGKSTVVANLAVVMAQAGNKTVVVDSDLRRPTVGALLGGGTGGGLSDVLSGKMALEDVITRTRVDGLYVVGTGTLPPNPSEMLGSRKMKQVIGELAKDFEFVLFDSPPVLPISDAAALGARVDGVLLVVRCDVTAGTGLSRALSVMNGVHAKVIGIVLNDLDTHHRIGGKYYDYDYRSYSQSDEADSKRK
ncbi:MAG: polysaccharide biosynthesis tyrosine autokinase [Candidatus Eisenbacteria bacterium]|nr:polysaccharide biosynthesis tyrosine autokinase [Candidatus Eisenbacteria bacterium]